MNTSVNKEIAKLLKEKGFDLPTKRFRGIIDSVESEHEIKNWNQYNNALSKPAVSEVVMWLHEKHGIWIVVKKDYNNGEMLGFEAIIDLCSEEGLVDCGTYASPTESYQEAIKYCLLELL